METAVMQGMGGFLVRLLFCVAALAASACNGPPQCDSAAAFGDNPASVTTATKSLEVVVAPASAEVGDWSLRRGYWERGVDFAVCVTKSAPAAFAPQSSELATVTRDQHAAALFAVELHADYPVVVTVYFGDQKLESREVIADCAEPLIFECDSGWCKSREATVSFEPVDAETGVRIFDEVWIGSADGYGGVSVVASRSAATEGITVGGLAPGSHIVEYESDDGCFVYSGRIWLRPGSNDLGEVHLSRRKRGGD